MFLLSDNTNEPPAEEANDEGVVLEDSVFEEIGTEEEGSGSSDAPEEFEETTKNETVDEGEQEEEEAELALEDGAEDVDYDTFDDVDEM